MAPVYFDTSVFLAVLAREPEALAVRGLLDELKADKVRIYTSILTIQEASVSSFMHGNMFADHHTRINRMARIKGITRDIALTAAKFEASVIAAAKKSKSTAATDRVEDNRRRKFDCFHIATALSLGCVILYAFDNKFESRCRQLEVPLRVLRPAPHKPSLPFEKE